MLAFGTIDGGLLLQVVWASTLAGIAVTFLFSLVVLFSARSAEARRNGHSTASMSFAVLAVATMAVFSGLVVYGVHILLTKT
jgi:hypothetical protein